MPIRFLLEHDHAFEPDDIAILANAFEQALQALRLVDREDPATILVARRIIECAKEGERDLDRLRDAGIGVDPNMAAHTPRTRSLKG